MKLAEYSATGSPHSAGASSTTPRATPSRKVEEGLRLTKVSSTAASSGRKRSTTAVICRKSETSRVASGWSVAAWITPSPTWVSRSPVASMTPHPVCRSPGSSPKTRISGSLPAMGSGAEARHHVFGHFEIGVDILDIIAVLERLEQLEKIRRRFLADFGSSPWTPDEPRRTGGPE